ncbi:MAG: flippase [Candidatus Eisenbacteria bacterium]
MRVLLRFLPARLRARLENSATLRNILPNTGWLLADRVLRMVVSLVVSVWVARYLGPEAFGRFNFAIAFVVLFAPLGVFGLERIAVRELVRSPGESGVILGSAFALRLAGGGLGALLAIGTMALLRRGDGEMLAMVAILSGGMLVQAFDVVDHWNQSRLQARASVLAMSAGFLAAAALRLVLILNHAPLIAFAWAWAAELVLGSLGLALSHRLREGARTAWRASGPRITSLARDGWLLLLSSVMVSVYTRVDQVMLGLMSNPAELGAYAVAVKLVEVWYFLPAAIVTSVFPSIVESRRLGDDVFYDRLQRLYNLMAAISFAVAIPVTFLAPWVVRFLFGEEYARAAPMLTVLVWSLPFTSLGLARGAFLSTMNWNGAYLMTVAAGCVANVGLNLLLIPRFGGMGAVIASCLAYWMAAHGACFLYRPLFRTGGMLTRALLPRRF